MDRAEAIKELESVKPQALRCANTVLCDAIDMAIAALREQEQASKVVEIDQFRTKWISVKERLPELEKEVLICDLDNDKYMDVWSLEDDEEGGVVWEGKNGEWYSLDEATHWMPLPEPPKEGADHA